jgi:hypothetical protein
MSDKLSDAEAKLLIAQMTRHDDLFAILARSPVRSPWFQVLPHMILGWAVTFYVIYTVRHGAIWQGLAFIAIIGSLVAVTALYAAGLDKRVNALVELLQQEGLLRRQLPASQLLDSRKREA